MLTVDICLAEQITADIMALSLFDCQLMVGTVLTQSILRINTPVCRNHMNLLNLHCES